MLFTMDMLTLCYILDPSAFENGDVGSVVNSLTEWCSSVEWALMTTE